MLAGQAGSPPAAWLAAQMDQQIDGARWRQRAPVRALFTQKRSEMRQIMDMSPRGVGRTSRGTQVREELRGHLSEQYGLKRRRRTRRGRRYQR